MNFLTDCSHAVGYLFSNMSENGLQPSVSSTDVAGEKADAECVAESRDSLNAPNDNISASNSDDDDLREQERVEEERRQIVELYDGGVDPSEKEELDPPCDRYGFIYGVDSNSGGRNKLSKQDKKRLEEHDKKTLEKEIQRRDKWARMIKQWDQYYPNDPKLRERIYKGIPNAVRGEVWFRLLRLEHVKKEQEGRYEEMRERARKISPDIRQIDLDVNRTYRSNVMFRKRYDIKQQQLFHVLAAYSVYNTEVGYCQGMSQIAALLLMYLSEEDAFWAISVLMTDPRFAMHGFFIPGFPKLARFQEHHDYLLKKFMPGLRKHLDKYDIHSSLYTLKWFFQCFLDRVPFTLTLRLWDIYLLDGERVLTCMSFTLLKLHERNLLRMNMEKLVDFLQCQLERDFGYHDDQAIEELEHNMKRLNRKRLDLPKPASSEEFPQRPFGLELPTPQTTRRRGKSHSVRTLSTLGGADSISVLCNGGDDDGEILERSDTQSLRSIRTPKELRRVESDVSSVASTPTPPSPHPFMRTAQTPSATSRSPRENERPVSIYDNVDAAESFQSAAVPAGIKTPPSTAASPIRIFVPYADDVTPTANSPPAPFVANGGAADNTQKTSPIQGSLPPRVSPNNSKHIIDPDAPFSWQRHLDSTNGDRTPTNDNIRFDGWESGATGGSGDPNRITIRVNMSPVAAPRTHYYSTSSSTSTSVFAEVHHDGRHLSTTTTTQRSTTTTQHNL